MVNITGSGKKFIPAAPNATIVGRKCTFEGCILHDKKIQKSVTGPSVRISLKYADS